MVGVVRSSEVPSSFVPPNTPETGQWFYLDVPEMARSTGLPEDTLLIDLIKREELEPGAHTKFPAPKDTEDLIRQAVMPDDHLIYAATW